MKKEEFKIGIRGKTSRTVIPIAVAIVNRTINVIALKYDYFQPNNFCTWIARHGALASACSNMLVLYKIDKFPILFRFSIVL